MQMFNLQVKFKKNEYKMGAVLLITLSPYLVKGLKNDRKSS